MLVSPSHSCALSKLLSNSFFCCTYSLVDIVIRALLTNSVVKSIHPPFPSHSLLSSPPLVPVVLNVGSDFQSHRWVVVPEVLLCFYVSLPLFGQKETWLLTQLGMEN